jgi:hypothetical protein
MSTAAAAVAGSAPARFTVAVSAVVGSDHSLAAELTGVSGEIFNVSAGQLLVGVPLAFSLTFAGTALPITIFIYAILLPWIARLTGSVATTAILGGVAYTVIHAFESWAVYSSRSVGCCRSSSFSCSTSDPGDQVGADAADRERLGPRGGLSRHRTARRARHRRAVRQVSTCVDSSGGRSE